MKRLRRWKQKKSKQDKLYLSIIATPTINYLQPPYIPTYLFLLLSCIVDDRQHYKNNRQLFAGKGSSPKTPEPNVQSGGKDDRRGRYARTPHRIPGRLAFLRVQLVLAGYDH